MFRTLLPPHIMQPRPVSRLFPRDESETHDVLSHVQAPQHLRTDHSVIIIIVVVFAATTVVVFSTPYRRIDSKKLIKTETLTLR